MEIYQSAIGLIRYARMIRFQDPTQRQMIACKNTRPQKQIIRFRDPAKHKMLDPTRIRQKDCPIQKYNQILAFGDPTERQIYYIQVQYP